MAKKKLHDRKKFITGTYSPEGRFYSTGYGKQAELHKCYGPTGSCLGMRWVTKDGTSWRKIKGDETTKEA